MRVQRIYLSIKCQTVIDKKFMSFSATIIVSRKIYNTTSAIRNELKRFCFWKCYDGVKSRLHSVTTLTFSLLLSNDFFLFNLHHKWAKSDEKVQFLYLTPILTHIFHSVHVYYTYTTKSRFLINL